MAGNPLANMLGGNNTMNPMVQQMMQNNPMFSRFGNISNMMKQFNEFKKTINITPEEAKAKILGMRDAGQITNEQIEEAKSFFQMIGMN